MSDEFTPARTAKPGPVTERREALGLTQEELAKRLGIDLSAMKQWERGGESPRDGASKEAVNPGVPRQLPATVPSFTGRTAELNALTRILDEASDDATPRALVISAISGTAGIGKTALALHWAHQVAPRFPDGQLHVNLRGFDPSGTPMHPADAIRGFLDALGVPPDRIPRDADAQADLYGSLLAGKQMLIVLDNARDEQQVRPLLPASPGSLVLVTSRNQITDLAGAEGARILSLDALTPGEAVQMLTARLGQGRAADAPGAVGEIATLCSYLPLALAVVAARVVARPRFSLSALAAELRDTAARLDALDVGDPRASVQAVFSWSYEQLSPEAARMFRLLGVHPGPDISIVAAAHLTGTDQADARHLLRELAHGCLITEHAPGRYTFHDLLRAYGARQAQTIDGESEITAALGRILDHYAEAACAAAILLYPSREMITFAASQAGNDAVKGHHFDDAQQARAWFEAEHPNLTASVPLAVERGFDRHAWQLPWFLGTHLARNSYSDGRVTLLRTALAAATRLEDIAGQAVSNRFMGNAYTDIGEWDQALDCYRVSSELYSRLGNRLGAMKAWQGIAMITGSLGRFAEALEYLEYGLRLYQEIGHKAGEAEMLVSMAWCHGGLAWGNSSIDHHHEAQDLARRALALATEAGNQYVEMLAWHRIGYGEHQLGEFAEALPCYQQALDAARNAGDRFHEADVLAHLGEVHHACGDVFQARESWSRALAILDDMQHPEADRVRANLTDPTLSAPSPSGASPFNRKRETADQAPDLLWCGVIRFSAPSQQLHSDAVKTGRHASPNPES